MTSPEPINAERLRDTLGGVSSPVMRGDNISIVLASYFEPSVESEEMDDSNSWKQGAVDAANEVLNAIHSHYAEALRASESARKTLESEKVAAEKERDEWKGKYFRRHNDANANFDRALAAEAALAKAREALKAIDAEVVLGSQLKDLLDEALSLSTNTG